MTKIEQLLGDSKAFDEKRFLGACDLVFVAGSHARSYVESDSRKALRMVKPGGFVFWHAYSGKRRASGVFAALNALAREIPLVHIGGTSLVAYRRPLAWGWNALTDFWFTLTLPLARPSPSPSPSGRGSG
jgi:hypothetical protein